MSSVWVIKQDSSVRNMSPKIHLIVPYSLTLAKNNFGLLSVESPGSSMATNFPGTTVLEPLGLSEYLSLSSIELLK